MQSRVDGAIVRYLTYLTYLLSLVRRCIQNHVDGQVRVFKIHVVGE